MKTVAAARVGGAGAAGMVWGAGAAGGRSSTELLGVDGCRVGGVQHTCTADVYRACLIVILYRWRSLSKTREKYYTNTSL